MDSVVKVLGGIKVGVETILKELNSLEKIQQISMNELTTYSHALHVVTKSIDRVREIFVSDIPIQHESKVPIINTVKVNILSLEKQLKKVTKWHNKVTNRDCKALCAVLKKRPSQVHKQLEKNLKEIEPLMDKVCELEESIFGSAIMIEHKVLQKVWMLAGSNQLGDTEHSQNQIIEGIYFILSKEEGGSIPDEEQAKQTIEAFVNSIDGCAGAKPDGLISIRELNVTSDRYKECITIKDILVTFNNSSKSKHDQDPITLDTPQTNTVETSHSIIDTSDSNHITIQANEEIKNIPILFPQPLRIKHNHQVLIPSCSGYGAGWPSAKACSFQVPSYNKHSLQKLIITCKANDQGWGNTNHAQVRYQVNDNPPVTAFSVQRDLVPDSMYSFTLGTDTIKSYDIITIWILCPPWGGWSIVLESIEAKATFIENQETYQ